MTENTKIKITYLISKDNYILKGEKQIIDDLRENLDTLYEYDDIKTERELNKFKNMISTNFDYVMNYVCDLMELDYVYLNDL